MAERVGFEPTSPWGLPDFESGPLWPLRYRSLYAQPLFFLAFFRWKRALERTDGKNSKLIQFSNRVKPAWLQGFGWTKRTAPRKISSQSRYDHFDTTPCIYLHISPQKHLGKRRELMERTKEYLLFNDSWKALWNQGFSAVSFQKGHSFSSRARYDRFDTSPFNNYLVFGANNMISSRSRYDHFDTSPW